MTRALFDAIDVYGHDPTDPPADGYTPPEIVAALTRQQRETRVERLVAQARGIYTDAVAAHAGNRQVAAVCVLLSGGGDSTVLAHLFRDVDRARGHADARFCDAVANALDQVAADVDRLFVLADRDLRPAEAMKQGHRNAAEVLRKHARVLRNARATEAADA